MCITQTVLVIALVLGLAYSWDIAVTAVDRIEFYTSNGTKKSTAHFDNQHLTAITYDGVHNILLYVDKQSDNDAICGYNITSVKYKCYTQRKGRNIQSLAFDPVTELLFFIDIKERSINSFSFKPESNNNVDGNLIIKMHDGIPTNIVADNCRRYIYWINRNLTTSTIERARFNGSEREVVIKAKYTLDLHSLAIDQQTQKIYWLMPKTGSLCDLYSADLDGKNSQALISYSMSGDGEIVSLAHPNKLTVSKAYLFVADWCTACGPISIWKYPTPSLKTLNHKPIFGVQTKNTVGITANYKIKEQFQGIPDCNHGPKTNDSNKITRECERSFCDHGIKVNGQSLCKYTPGYTGTRCNVSICEKYCLQGNCSLSEKILPKCRCNAGYSGDRCEVNVCNGYCLNNGSCSLNKNSEPVCQCKEDYVGHRCQETACKNYCLQGNCSFSDDGFPICRCNAGYSGERCEVNVCNGYCLNNGSCSLNKNSEPVCHCKEDYVGHRCQETACKNYCLQGNCSFSDDGFPVCSCNAGYSGEKCEVNVCNGYCLNNGSCSLNVEDEPFCECDGEYDGVRCEVPICLKNVEGIPDEEGCSHGSSRCKTYKFKTTSKTSAYYLIEKKLSLTDLLENWHKHAHQFP